MFPVFRSQWRKDKRKPLMVILFLVGSIALTLIFTSSNMIPQTSIAVFSSESNSSEVVDKWEPILNRNESFNFVITDEKTARTDVAEGKRDIAINLMEHDYRLISAYDVPTLPLIDQYVRKVFTEEAQMEAAAGPQDIDDIRHDVENYLENPPLQLKTKSMSGEELSEHNMGIQLLFGFTLFMAMFTIGFKVNGVLSDKVSGIWNRMILSPVSKTGMYTGHLLYSFLIGFVQIAVVLFIFQYVMSYNLGNNFAMLLVIAAIYALSIVSMAMLITGFVKTPEQFYMIYPSVVPIIPVISGVYMPPGTISNAVLLFIADLFPLRHAMDAMMDVAFYNAGWNEIALPLVLMLLIGVICMGLGINLVERKKD
ncbi:ABC transporter permease [Oceanobacillus sp. FSL K6-2867]|uniref:ABC transporter permease n=1 Tax=Oceanobacillus sp. FSL K6-2867 TaxID=2954748 RepID=UPI0030DA094D